MVTAASTVTYILADAPTTGVRRPAADPAFNLIELFQPAGG